MGKGKAVFFSLVLSLCSALPLGRAWAACAVGDKAQVLWKGTWYPASVIKVKEERCYIHYDGYGKNWDEWVGSDRIRVIGHAGAPTPPAGNGKPDRSRSR